MNNLQHWQTYLRCPLDRQALLPDADGGWKCPSCHFHTTETAVKDRRIPDFRALDQPQTITMQVEVPVKPLDRYQVAQTHFRAINASFDHFSPAQVRQQFKTKLDKAHQYYSQQLLREQGADAVILDLGCGSGGNRRYLQSLGFKNVLTVDWIADGADMLVDAHRLPLASETFHMVISTAVFEHLYNPFIAMSEISRILKPGGYFVGGASFWEAWHGSSYFHLTPDGWNALLRHGDMTLEDLWVGWGIIPSALSHVLTPAHFRRLGYGMQSVVEAVYRLFMGESGVRKLQLRASGSYQVFAKKAGQP